MYSIQILNRDTQIRHIMYTDIETDRYTDIEKDRDSQSSTVLSCRFFLILHSKISTNRKDF